MRNTREKTRWINFFHSKPVLGILTVLFFLSAWSIIGFWGKMEDTRRNKEMAQEKLLELEQSKAKLESDIAKLETDRGVEEVLRENFGLAREGEGLIVVVEDTRALDEDVDDGGRIRSFFRNLFNR